MNDNEIEPQYTDATTAEVYRRARRLKSMLVKRFGNGFKFDPDNSIDVNTKIVEQATNHVFMVRVDIQGRGGIAQSVQTVVTMDSSEVELEEKFQELDRKIANLAVHLAYRAGQIAFSRTLKSLVDLGG